MLAIQHSMDEPISFLIPEDGKAVAEQLEEFVKEHNIQVGACLTTLYVFIVDKSLLEWEHKYTISFEYML